MSKFGFFCSQTEHLILQLALLGINFHQQSLLTPMPRQGIEPTSVSRVAPDWDLSDALPTELHRRGKIDQVKISKRKLTLPVNQSLSSQWHWARLVQPFYSYPDLRQSWATAFFFQVGWNSDRVRLKKVFKVFGCSNSTVEVIIAHYQVEGSNPERCWTFLSCIFIL